MNIKTELVSNDYYQQELQYQERLNAIKNTTKLSDIIINKSNGALEVALPKEMQGYKVQGQAWLYCKTNSDNDKHENFSTTDGFTSLSLDKLQPGAFTLKLSWKAGDEDYYVEKDFTL